MHSKSDFLVPAVHPSSQIAVHVAESDPYVIPVAHPEVSHGCELYRCFSAMPSHASLFVGLTYPPMCDCCVCCVAVYDVSFYRLLTRMVTLHISTAPASQSTVTAATSCEINRRFTLLPDDDVLAPEDN